MTLSQGAVFGAAALVAAAIIYGFVRLWKLIPAYQCPRCYSYDTTALSEDCQSCNDCGKEWNPNEQ